MAAVLFGDSDPGGCLPATLPADAGQGPGTTTSTYPHTNGTVTHVPSGSRHFSRSRAART